LNAALILKLLDGLVAASDIYVQIQTLRAQISTMQAEGRDPSPEEWDKLLAEIQTDSDRIDAADKRANP
jgi:hypothetical protein